MDPRCVPGTTGLQYNSVRGLCGLAVVGLVRAREGSLETQGRQGSFVLSMLQLCEYRSSGRASRAGSGPDKLRAKPILAVGTSSLTGTSRSLQARKPRSDKRR